MSLLFLGCLHYLPRIRYLNFILFAYESRANRMNPFLDHMIRKIFALLLILLSLINVASSGSDVDAYFQSSESIDLMSHSIKFASHNSLEAHDFHHKSASTCKDEFDANQLDCQTKDDSTNDDCHHCHCPHLDSIQSPLSPFSYNQNCQKYPLLAVAFLLKDTISSLIRPPETSVLLFI